MTLDLQAVARAIGAEGDPPAAKVTGWSVDSRTQNPGDVYFALHGLNFDGHDFTVQALEKGAAAAVVERRPEGVAGECLLVADTLRALQDAGHWARGQWGGTV